MSVMTAEDFFFCTLHRDMANFFPLVQEANYSENVKLLTDIYNKICATEIHNSDIQLTEEN